MTKKWVYWDCYPGLRPLPAFAALPPSSDFGETSRRDKSARQVGETSRRGKRGLTRGYHLSPFQGFDLKRMFSTEQVRRASLGPPACCNGDFQRLDRTVHRIGGVIHSFLVTYNFSLLLWAYVTKGRLRLFARF